MTDSVADWAYKKARELEKEMYEIHTRWIADPDCIYPKVIHAIASALRKAEAKGRDAGLEEAATFVETNSFASYADYLFVKRILDHHRNGYSKVFRSLKDPKPKGDAQ